MDFGREMAPSVSFVVGGDLETLRRRKNVEVSHEDVPHKSPSIEIGLDIETTAICVTAHIVLNKDRWASTRENRTRRVYRPDGSVILLSSIDLA
jgi:hypothetical protein